MYVCTKCIFAAFYTYTTIVERVSCICGYLWNTKVLVLNWLFSRGEEGPGGRAISKFFFCHMYLNMFASNLVALDQLHLFIYILNLKDSKVAKNVEFTPPIVGLWYNHKKQIQTKICVFKANFYFVICKTNKKHCNSKTRDQKWK